MPIERPSEPELRPPTDEEAGDQTPGPAVHQRTEAIGLDRFQGGHQPSTAIVGRGPGRDARHAASWNDRDSLAMGTDEMMPEQDRAAEDRTKVESPVGRKYPPMPPERLDEAAVAPPRRAAPAAPRAISDVADQRSLEAPEDHIGKVMGSYRIIEPLGKGGMGFVFRAEHTRLGREVALKLLRGDYSRRRDAVARFFQEARTVNRVRHRNIVDVTDLIELDDGSTFIIMELLRGDSLGRWSRTGIDLPRAIMVLIQICEGLAAAHAVGVVHRDLKPDNIVVVPDPDGEIVKLLDFGVAKLMNRDDEDVAFETAAGAVIGTPAYMSPEQAGGMTIDGRSDIYSLGAIMYELFCGQTMFSGKSFGEFVRKHLTEPPVPPRATPAGAALDERIEAVILRCIEKEPQHRYQNVHELRDALHRLLEAFEDDDATARAPTARPVAGASAGGVRQVLTGNQRRPTQPAELVGFASLTTDEHGPASSIGRVSVISLTSNVGRTSQRGVPNEYLSGVSAGIQTGTGGVPAALRPPTPWWVWFVGGALAVGIGSGGAAWYVSHSGNTPGSSRDVRPATIPVTVPIPTPMPVVRTAIDVRVAAEPSGTVYADGSDVALCETPCAVHLEGPSAELTGTRAYVVRKAGFVDHRFVVDLAAVAPQYQVALTASPGAVAPDAAVPGKLPPKKAPGRLPPKQAPAGDPGKQAPGKRTGIDPSMTVDPFHRQKP